MIETVNASSSSLEVVDIPHPKLQLKKLVLRELSTLESSSGSNRSNRIIFSSATGIGDSTKRCGCCA
jgi:hypothetical protein